MHITENQYINSVNSHINAIKHMHDLTVNFQVLVHILFERRVGNLKHFYQL
jgi:hypothetical protein